MGRGVTAICIGVAGNSVASTKVCGVKMFDFRRKTLFCLGYRLSKHKMTTNSKKLGGTWSFCPPPPVATPMQLRFALQLSVTWGWGLRVGHQVRLLTAARLPDQRHGLRNSLATHETKKSTGGSSWQRCLLAKQALTQGCNLQDF